MDDVTQAIIAGGLGDDAITLENRVQIAKHFVTQLEDGVSKNIRTGALSAFIADTSSTSDTSVSCTNIDRFIQAQQANYETAFVPNGEVFQATENRMIYGASGTETITLSDGLHVSIDGNIENLVLPSNQSEYQFIVDGTAIEIYKSLQPVATFFGVNNTVNIQFADNNAELKLTGLGQAVLGNAPISRFLGETQPVEPPENSTCSPREFSDEESAVNDLYLAYYGRPADTGGLGFWAGSESTDIAQAFGASGEYSQYIGQLSPSEQVTQLFSQLFGVTPTADELQAYVNQLEAGQITVDLLPLQILIDAQNEQLAILDNRRLVSQTYITYLEAASSYNGNPRDIVPIIAQVSDTTASANSACESLAQLFNDYLPGQTFRDTLSDNTEGPLMVVIPAGTFQMGDSQGVGESDELPVHTVTISKDFALGAYEVTFDEYDAFAQATGRSLPEDEGFGRGTRPVMNVSWNDATAYAEWLSQQTGETYRLPTEAEWEYSTRAGTETKYWWGNSIDCSKADYWNGSSCNGVGTSPVGSYEANPFGLFDVHGNVWEWVQDWYSRSYYGDSESTDPSGPATGSNRVLRGGSWYDDARGVRSAYRNNYSPDFRFYEIGFRLARTL